MLSRLWRLFLRLVWGVVLRAIVAGGVGTSCELRAIELRVSKTVGFRAGLVWGRALFGINFVKLETLTWCCTPFHCRGSEDNAVKAWPG